MAVDFPAPGLVQQQGGPATGRSPQLLGQRVQHSGGVAVKVVSFIVYWGNNSRLKKKATVQTKCWNVLEETFFMNKLLSFRMVRWEIHIDWRDPNQKCLYMFNKTTQPGKSPVAASFFGEPRLFRRWSIYVGLWRVVAVSALHICLHYALLWKPSVFWPQADDEPSVWNGLIKLVPHFF